VGRIAYDVAAEVCLCVKIRVVDERGKLGVGAMDGVKRNVQSWGEGSIPNFIDHGSNNYRCLRPVSNDWRLHWPRVTFSYVRKTRPRVTFLYGRNTTNDLPCSSVLLLVRPGLTV